MHAPLGAQAQEVRPDLAALTAAALEKNLDAHPVWHALLHQTEGKLQIRDAGFVLSTGHFSSRNELIATLAQQFGPQSGADMRCKFPARYLWLGQQLGVDTAPLTTCDALTEYQEKVPVDTISLVFASENLNQPSSMMGHVFLKLSGKNRVGELREHAVTFYTDADTINLPKLLFQNVFSGMPGWYSVLPYHEVLAQYTVAEDRNVWDFEIRMDAWTRNLLRLHLFELRDVQFKYYFHTYNCATLVDELLTVVQAQATASLPADALWTTPKDVVKRAHALGLIADTQVTPAQSWLVRSIEKQLSADQIRTVKQWAVGTPGAAPDMDFGGFDSEASRVLGWQLANTYNQYLYQNHRIAPALWSQHQQHLAHNPPATVYELQVPDNARPQNAPGDSQFILGHTVRDGRAYVSASYLPTSHTLLDDSAQGLGQSALTLLQATVFKALTDEHVFIDQFVLYASQTRLPWSPLVGGVSRGVRLAYEMQYSQYSEARHATHATSSWGVTYPLGKDLLAYADVDAGVGAAEQGLYLEASPGVGLLMYELWGMKTHIAFRQHHNALGQGGLVNHLAVTHKWRVSPSNSIEIDWASAQGSQQDVRSTQTTWRWKIIF